MLTLLLASLTNADAAPVKVTTVMATSTYPTSDGVSYKEQHTIDGKMSTVWVEGDEAGSGLGVDVEFTFDAERTIDSLRIWNGNYYSYDFWQRHNRIKEAELEFSDGSKQRITFSDEMKPELIKLEKPVTTSSVKLRIKGIYSGSTFNDTVISEVIFYDDKPEPHYEVKAWKASSVYAADADGSYELTNLADGVVDSMWCEADEGDGTGQWVEADLGATRDVGKLEIVNGNGYSLPVWMKSNRTTQVKLTFSDGSSETVDVKNSLSKQTVEFSTVSTSKVRMEFVTVYAGKEFNDMCVSELYFLE